VLVFLKQVTKLAARDVSVQRLLNHSIGRVFGGSNQFTSLAAVVFAPWFGG
jgi:hypothetical protein